MNQKKENQFEGQIIVPIDWKLSIIFTITTILTLVFYIFTNHDLQSNYAFITSSGNLFFDKLDLTLPSATTILISAIIEILITAYTFFEAIKRKKPTIWLILLYAVAWIFSFITWQIAGNEMKFFFTSLLSGALALSVPLIFGALSGLICEHVGVVNIAIEGQLLFGAFSAVLTGSIVRVATGNDFFALLAAFIAAPISGVLMGLILALFSVKYFVNQMIVGVLINVLAAGLTAYLYSTIMTDNPLLNQALKLPIIRIPFLADIPIIGDVLFNQSIMVYLMYLIVFGLQFLLYHSRWGLRMMACGEHPKGADTLGINVNKTRFHNVLLGSAIAGLGGAYFTIAQGLTFTEGISSGKGYIALAAMIMGKWKPNGALAAAFIFGFADALQMQLGIFGTAIPSSFLLMFPYIITIFAVAGIIGKVTAPAAEGKPYLG